MRLSQCRWFVCGFSPSLLACAALGLNAQSADVAKLLKDIKARDKGQLAVSEEDGRFLRLMVSSTGRSVRSKLAVPAGTAPSGSVWDCGRRAAASSRSSTIPGHAKELGDNVRRAGWPMWSGPFGDAFQQIPNLWSTFDFVFLDAWKKDYKQFRSSCIRDLTRRTVHRAQRGEQAERDGRFPRRRPEASVALDHDRVPLGRGMSVSLKR